MSSLGEESPVPSDRNKRPRRFARVVAALFATGLALAFLWAASRASDEISFPPVAFAERLIRLAPGDAATFFIDTLGHLALVLLSVGAVLCFLALGALLPLAIGGGERPRPYLTGAAFGLIGASATLAAPVAPAVLPTVLSSAAAAGLYAVSVDWLVGVVGSSEVEADRSRRAALASAGAAVLGFVAAGTVLGRLARRFAGPNTDVAIRSPDVRAPSPERPPFPAIAGLSPEVTSADDHYVVDIDLVDPTVEADGWVLEVEGLVEKPLALSFAGLQRDFELVEQHSVLTCISNTVGGPLVGSSRWMGVRLADVLERVGVAEAAVDVVFRCADGYSSSIPVRAAQGPSVLLAIAQNGHPLQQEHGFPCRVRAPEFYGVKNAKWLERIELVGDDYRDYWTERGWSERAVVRTQSRIDSPKGEVAAGEPAWVAGVAWAGTRGISRVEVSLDEGRSWEPAQLNTPLSEVAWMQWAYRWVPSARGTQAILCRAADGTGDVQERTARRPHPSGASGYDELEIDVI